jgi:hypothetical protein
MDPDFAQRRRFLIAIAVTLILVPGAFLLNRNANETGASPAVTMVGTVPDATPVAASVPTSNQTGQASDETDPLGTISVGYLQGTVVPNTADPPTIAIPRPQEVNAGLASFSYDIEIASECRVLLAPNGVRVTVTNLDNSRSVQCVNSLINAEQPHEVMLSSGSFVLIADLTDAPVHVEVNW